MKDFTTSSYRKLLDALIHEGYAFQTVRDFVRSPAGKVILLRQDVDDRKMHSLHFARIQHEYGIQSTFYFRVVPESYDPEVIREIASMGHEIGYHYEDMDFAHGDPVKALEYFEKHLNKLRLIVPIETICMHGSHRSKHDNRDIWKSYDYKNYKILAEPYLDLDFQKIFYLTDTGRRWDGYKVSVRDKVKSNFNLSFHRTDEIIESIKSGAFPDQVMFNFHPERWTDNSQQWWRDYFIQKLKNTIKYVLIKLRKTN